MAAASAARHDTRALLRAHLAAASRYGHLTRHCVVCHRLLRLSMELPEPDFREPGFPEPDVREPGFPGAGSRERPEPPDAPEPAEATEDESPTDP
ncbi:DUF6274 family protein [Streptomyces zaomyceticus]|uniref:DUF6274 family protein n=1 Tax=Streptomyces zaomyceticus TaxID=68286 RepID=UPI001675C3E1|nr:DUF6274 family protein [Streptomyces zaomyceticus]GHG33502.1 hypothetical protein GCM10018791_58280 [Streptomyces zaomyceticus]